MGVMVARSRPRIEPARRAQSLAARKMPSPGVAAKTFFGLAGSTARFQIARRVAGLLVAHVAPPSVLFETHPEAAPTHTTAGFTGSTATDQITCGASPLPPTDFHVAAPSVVLKRPSPVL